MCLYGLCVLSYALIIIADMTVMDVHVVRRYNWTKRATIAVLFYSVLMLYYHRALLAVIKQNTYQYALEIRVRIRVRLIELHYFSIFTENKKNEHLIFCECHGR